MNSYNQNRTGRLVRAAMLCTIIIIMNFTPLGYIQLPIIRATLIHIPVIIGSIVLGPKIGAGLGFVFGLTSLYNNTFTPTLLSFAFSPFVAVPGNDGGNPAALLVTFLPRILTGVFPYLLFRALSKWRSKKGRFWKLALSGLAGSMTNTLLVTHLIYFLFRDAYMEANQLTVATVYRALMGIVLANGIPEAIAAALITAAVCRVLLMKELAFED